MTEKAKKLRKITATFLIVFVSVGFFWDVYVAYNDVHDDTISELLRDLGHQWYFLPWVFGVVCGHLFINKKSEDMLPREQHLKMFFTRVVPAGALVLLRDVANLFYDVPTFGHASLILLLVGIATGATFWPQALPESTTTKE